MTEADTSSSVLATGALVAVGGVAGANARYLTDVAVGGRLATLAANVVGAVLLGVVLYRAVYAGRLDERVRLALGTGALSSLTTYSAFALQTVQATPAVAVAYVCASYGLGFAGVLAGRAVARLLWRRPGVGA